MIGLAADPLKTALTLGCALSLIAGLEGMQGEELQGRISNFNSGIQALSEDNRSFEELVIAAAGVILQKQRPGDDSRLGSVNDIW